MANRLEDRLLSGERVVFRTRFDLTWTGAYSVAFAAILAGMVQAFDWFFDLGVNLQRHIVEGLSSIGFVGLWLWNRAVLVTDKRVIYTRDDWKRSVREMPLAAIERVVFHPGVGNWIGFVSIRVRSGENIVLRLIPKLQELRDAIAAQCGLSVSPSIGPKILGATALVNVLSVTGALSAFVWFMDFAFDFFETGLPTLPDTAFYGLMISSPFVGIAFGLIGGALGNFLGLLGLRIILTPEEAQNLLRVDAMVPRNDWEAKFSRWSSRLTAKVLGWLYGQSVNPED